MRRALAIVTLALVATTLSACSSDSEDEKSDTTTPKGTDAAAASTLAASDFAFAPTEITLTAGPEVSLEVSNEGKVEHNLTIEGLGVDKDLEAGSTTRVSVTPRAGTFEFHCEYHPAAMKGTVTVS